MRSLIFVVLIVLSAINISCSRKSDGLNLIVNWPDFMSRNDMIWTDVPSAWTEAPFTGNGIIGTIFWRQGKNMYFEISRTDAYDHRNGSSIYSSRYRMPNGGFRMAYTGEYQGGNMRLDLWNAEARGEIITSSGKINLRNLTHAQDEIILLEIETMGNERIDFNWEADTCQTSRITERGKPGTTPYPVQQTKIIDGVNVSVLEMPENEQYNTHGTGVGQLATGWKIVDGGNGKKFIFITEKYSYPGARATADAVDEINKAVGKGIESFVNSHRDWWQNYYSQSFVSIPNSRLESFYWIQMYKMASATRGDRPMMDLAGPWYMKNTKWPGIWWNLNVQSSYAPFFTSNHEEEGASLINWMWKYRDNLEKNAQGYGRYAIGRSCPITLERDCDTEGYEVGNLGYALYNVWEQYQSTMDDSLLKEKLFPLMKGHYRFYKDFYVEKRDDRQYHLKPSSSPEYTRSGYPPPPDCNYNFSILKWMTSAMIYADARLGLNDPIIEEVKDVNRNLADYPVHPEEGFMVGEDQPFAYSHRHWSHLFMIYPFYEYTYDDPEHAQLIDKSLKHWLSYSEAYRGYSWLAASSIASMKGDGATAIDYLLRSLDHERYPALPNTLYIEGAPVIETPLLAARSTLDMILSSYNGIIRIFPAMPGDWKEASFHNLRAKGGFLVSAKRTGGATEFIRIESLAGEVCRVRTGMSGEIKTVGTRNFHIKNIREGVVEIDLKKGESVVLYTGKAPDLSIDQVPVMDNTNYWGTITDHQKKLEKI